MNDGPPAHTPPRLAEKVLARLFPDQGAYTTLGDLAEVYSVLAAEEGVGRANRWYWMQLVRSVGPWIVNLLYWGGIMFKNYVTVAVRNLRRQMVYTVVNVFGLALAIACGVLIFYFIRSEMTYDAFHERADDLYRVTSVVQFQGLETWDSTPYPLAAAIEENVSGVEAVARFVALPPTILRIDEQVIEQPIHLAGSAFFDLFDFSLQRADGPPQALLEDPTSVIISEAVWKQHFSGQDPVGKRIAVNLRDDVYVDFTVRGVAAPIPEPSSIRFDFLFSEKIYDDLYNSQAAANWFPKTRVCTFVLAALQVRREDLQANLETIAEAQGLGALWRIETVDTKLPLQALREIHLSEEVPNTLLAPNGNATYSYILGLVAVLVLLVACINFMNLAIGLSTTRSKEVGIRKVLGAQPTQLIRQFWFESGVLSILALGVGLLLAHAFLPVFNALADKRLVLDYYYNGVTVAVLLGLTGGIAFLSGMYPALVLSRLRPVTIFKGVLNVGGRRIFSRAMITFQFMLAIFLMACTLIMSSQLRHVSRQSLGYDVDLLVYQRLTKRADEALVERYRRAALQRPDVVGVSATRAMLVGDVPGSVWMVSFEGERMTVPAHKIDYDFLDVMDIRLIAGRNLSREHPGDPTGAVLVNETFVSVFGLEDPIGQPAPFDGDAPVIVGVVQDFHFQSLRKPLEPLVMYLRPDSDYTELITRIRGERLDETLAFLQQAWEGLGTGTLFNYTFLDEVVQNQYETERHFRSITTYTSYFALLIACLGLFGLTALSVARRTREMGIRKVMGASTGRILLLFNKEYLYLLMGANLVAWPVAYYVMTRWLENFASRIDIGVGLFVGAGSMVAVLAVLTITTQALKTSRINPVETLRYE